MKKRELVFITGSSMGIGRATALKFLRKKYDVVGMDIQESTINNPHYTHIVGDIRNVEDYPDINPHILIVNAGTNDDDIAIEVNLLGSIKTINKYIDSPNLKSILVVASVAGTSGCDLPNYVASKGGLKAYTLNLANRLAPRLITVNSVSAGMVLTEMNKDLVKDKKLYTDVVHENLFHRSIDPKEVGELIYYLTVINKSITGEDIIMDSGEFARFNFIATKEQEERDYFYKKQDKRFIDFNVRVK